MLITQLDEKYLSTCLNAAKQLREKNINTEVYSEPDKMSKQLKYANKLGIPFVIVIGEEEKKAGKLSLKVMSTGEQRLMAVEEVIGQICAAG